MSYDFNKAPWFGFVADVDLHGSIGDELRAAINPDTLQEAFRLALQEFFEGTGEVVVMNKQEGSGYHIAAPACVLDKVALEGARVDWRRLYEEIVTAAKHKLEQQQGISVPPGIFDFLESGQLRMAGLPKSNALNWASAYAPVGTHPRDLTREQMAELSGIVLDASVAIPLRDSVCTMPRLRLANGSNGSSSSTGVTNEAFANVPGSANVLSALAAHSHFGDCTYSISSVTGGDNNGCYRLKVNEITNPCIFTENLHHRQQNGGTGPRPAHSEWRAVCAV